MELKYNDYLRDFIKTLSEEEKELGYSHIRQICNGPFYFLKEQIQGGTLPFIRFLHFGIFCPSMGKARKILEKAETRLAKGYINEEQFYEIKNMVNNFLKRSEYEKNHF